MYTNEEFLDILYGTYKDADEWEYPYCGECKQYDILFSNRRNLLPSYIRSMQTQNGIALDIQNCSAQKMVFWKHCDSLKDFGLSAFDIEVYNAVCSLYIAFNEYVSPSTIFKALSGNHSTPSCISQSMRKRITQSLDKLRSTSITIGDDNKRYKLLSFTKVDNILFYGKPIQGCIRINEVPSLLVYAREKKELDCDEVKLLNTPLQNTAENITLKSCLFRIIKAANDLDLNDEIFDLQYKALYEALEKRASNPNALKSKKRQLRSKIDTLLNHWDAMEFIKSDTQYDLVAMLTL